MGLSSLNPNLDRVYRGNTRSRGLRQCLASGFGFASLALALLLSI